MKTTHKVALVLKRLTGLIESGAVDANLVIDQLEGFLHSPELRAR